MSKQSEAKEKQGYVPKAKWRGSLHRLAWRPEGFTLRACHSRNGVAFAAGQIVPWAELDRRVLRRMHPGRKHAITYDFRDGRTMLGCARKWKLRLTVIEQIIREHIR